MKYALNGIAVAEQNVYIAIAFIGRIKPILMDFRIKYLLGNAFYCCHLNLKDIYVHYE